MIRILIVDDSAFMRKALSMMLEEDPQIEVIDTARDGQEGLEKVKALRPDLVTMDVEMPRMDGITALKRIMAECPTPVVMVSSLTKEGAQTTVEALQAGAVDFIPKQLSFVSLEITKIKDDLITKVKSIASSRSSLFRRSASGSPRAGGVRRRAGAAPASSPFLFRSARCVAIGVSTGGPFALQHVIPKLPADFPVPVVIVQHMPPHFTKSLADRLNSMSALEVCEAEHGMEVRPGRVLIAPGGRHLTFQKRGLQVFAQTPEAPADTLHRPSVDVMFTSADEVFGGQVLGVIMTGMGKDGLEGARALRAHGGRLLAQDEASCVVYGMPRAVAEAGLADAELPLDDLAPTITKALRGPGAVRPTPSPARMTPTRFR